MIWPVPGYYTITSGFADTRSYGMHAGFDIAAPAVPCVAVGNGIVIYTGWAGSAGRSVYVELEGGYRVHYCHLSNFNVIVGQAVAAGDVIGLVGGSGDGIDGRWGLHLHLNLFAAAQPAGEPSKWIGWVGMWAVDPELYLQEEDNMAWTEAEKAHVENITKVVDELRRTLGMAPAFGHSYPPATDLLARLAAGEAHAADDSKHGSTGAGDGYTDRQAVKAVRDALD